jgi:hypothetical protein
MKDTQLIGIGQYGPLNLYLPACSDNTSTHTGFMPLLVAYFNASDHSIQGETLGHLCCIVHTPRSPGCFSKSAQYCIFLKGGGGLVVTAGLYII